jgi:hypothetical protein
MEVVIPYFDDLVSSASKGLAHKGDAREVPRKAERQRIPEALSRFERVGDTAHSLGISPVTLWSKLKRFGLANPVLYQVAADTAGSSAPP